MGVHRQSREAAHGLAACPCPGFAAVPAPETGTSKNRADFANTGRLFECLTQPVGNVGFVVAALAGLDLVEEALIDDGTA